MRKEFQKQIQKDSLSQMDKLVDLKRNRKLNERNMKNG